MLLMTSYQELQALNKSLGQSLLTTVGPCYNEPRYNKDHGRYNEQHLKAQQNYSKICGNKPRYNELC